MKQLLGKYIPYPLFAAAFQIARERPRAIARSRKLRELGLPDWSEIDLLKCKTSDTLFILGSGESINLIESSKWSGIAQHDSIGLNFWLCHWFVPTFYFFEAIHVNHSRYGTLGWRMQVLTKLMNLLKERASDYQGVPKFVDELRHDEHHWHALLPEFVKQDLYVANTLLLPARNYIEARRTLRILASEGTFKKRGRLGLVPKFGFSVGTLLSLAICLRYRNVVLCGVDMTSPTYFYEDESLYPEMTGFRSSPALPSHMSRSSWGLRCSFFDFLLALRDEIMTPLGVNLYVESPSSALHPNVEMAPQHLFASSKANTSQERPGIFSGLIMPSRHA